jgi:glycosyltransferase involved in cell wall biosynthesis
MNYKIIVSIIIRNRNGAAFLPHIFASLEKQRFRNFEIIFVDNESTDNSVALAKAAGQRYY